MKHRNMETLKHERVNALKEKSNNDTIILVVIMIVAKIIIIITVKKVIVGVDLVYSVLQHNNLNGLFNASNNFRMRLYD